MWIHFCYDIKVMDRELHKKYIGVDNDLILKNLEQLSKDGARIYIRIPTVKEVNGTREQMQEIISYLDDKKIHVAQINLLAISQYRGRQVWKAGAGV